MTEPERIPCDCGEFIDDLPDLISHCFVHHRNEPIPEEGPFRICGECSHVFPTAQALVDDYNLESVEMTFHDPEDQSLVPLKTEDQVDEIPTCPHCTHDF